MINIIGGGLAGSFIARRCEDALIPHRVFDCGDRTAASLWSENLFVESWMRGSPGIHASLEWLYDHYAVRLLSFRTGRGRVSAHHIPVAEVMHKDVINARIKEITPEGVTSEDGRMWPGRTIVAAGASSGSLAGTSGVAASVGHVLLFDPTERNRDVGNVMRVFRPYKHEKVMMHSDGRVRYADSLTVRADTYAKNADTYRKQAEDRARRLGLDGRYAYEVGHRPIVKGRARRGLVKQVREGVHICTGGYTNGMILYPELAREVLENMGYST